MGSALVSDPSTVSPLYTGLHMTVSFSRSDCVCVCTAGADTCTKHKRSQSCASTGSGPQAQAWGMALLVKQRQPSALAPACIHVQLLVAQGPFSMPTERGWQEAV